MTLTGTVMADFSRIRALLEQRRPGHSLPQAFYTDPEILDFDMQAIYGQSWILVRRFVHRVPPSVPGWSVPITNGPTISKATW